MSDLKLMCTWPFYYDFRTRFQIKVSLFVGRQGRITYLLHFIFIERVGQHLTSIGELPIQFDHQTDFLLSELLPEQIQ